MSKRNRSPNYPAIGLAEALTRLQTLWDAIQRSPAPREDIAVGLGYSGLHGASATAVSALRKYGLLDREGNDLRISERGMVCLHPQGPEERASAIREAATTPELFAALAERFPGGVINDELVRNHLLRNNFTPAAAANAILAYRETMELVESEGSGYNPAKDEPEQEAGQAMHQAAISPGGGKRVDAPVSAPPDLLAGKFRFSMTDDYFVDINASRLDQSGVQKLIDLLQANRELVPEALNPVEMPKENEQ